MSVRSVRYPDEAIPPRVSRDRTDKDTLDMYQRMVSCGQFKPGSKTLRQAWVLNYEEARAQFEAADRLMGDPNP